MPSSLILLIIFLIFIGLCAIKLAENGKKKSLSLIETDFAQKEEICEGKKYICVNSTVLCKVKNEENGIIMVGWLCKTENGNYFAYEAKTWLLDVKSEIKPLSESEMKEKLSRHSPDAYQQEFGQPEVA